eukprot:TRINITY_DN72177_c0_g1_i1.p1 TRINITY_DN72177_c0_g1~~TRINITY_DN72177_c0_g1_i1.p1  ORF type:complete len:453 (+),score=34.91 TRINITY_DN72177_c0_g1_i1:83-1441(+)
MAGDMDEVSPLQLLRADATWGLPPDSISLSWLDTASPNLLTSTPAALRGAAAALSVCATGAAIWYGNRQRHRKRESKQVPDSPGPGAELSAAATGLRRLASGSFRRTRTAVVSSRRYGTAEMACRRALRRAALYADAGVMRAEIAADYLWNHGVAVARCVEDGFLEGRDLVLSGAVLVRDPTWRARALPAARAWVGACIEWLGDRAGDSRRDLPRTAVVCRTAAVRTCAACSSACTAWVVPRCAAAWAAVAPARRAAGTAVGRGLGLLSLAVSGLLRALERGGAGLLDLQRRAAGAAARRTSPHSRTPRRHAGGTPGTSSRRGQRRRDPVARSAQPPTPPCGRGSAQSDPDECGEAECSPPDEVAESHSPQAHAPLPQVSPRPRAPSGSACSARTSPRPATLAATDGAGDACRLRDRAGSDGHITRQVPPAAVPRGDEAGRAYAHPTGVAEA